MIATWQVVNAMLAGAVIIWFIVVYRERRARDDYMSGAALALGAAFLAWAAVAGSVYNFRNSIGFRPAMPFVTIGCLLILISARRTIRGAANRRRRQDDDPPT